MKKFFSWLAIFGILAVTYGTMYTVTQQAQRSAANYPQIQLAEDTAFALNRGDPPITTVFGKVIIGSSLAPYTTIYDKKGQPIISTGELDGKRPEVPIGVLRAAQGKAYHAVTLEPKDGVRIAAVTVAAKDYYVLSGRSLREVEKDETNTLLIVVAGVVLSLLLLGAAIVANLVRGEYA